MPIYEYRCDKGHLSEVIRKVELRNEPSECPTCHGPAVRAGIERSHFNLVDDAFQTCGWTNPGMSGVNYQSGKAPDGIRRRELHPLERGAARGD